MLFSRQASVPTLTVEIGVITLHIKQACQVMTLCIKQACLLVVQGGMGAFKNEHRSFGGLRCILCRYSLTCTELGMFFDVCGYSLRGKRNLNPGFRAASPSVALRNCSTNVPSGPNNNTCHSLSLYHWPMPSCGGI